MLEKWPFPHSNWLDTDDFSGWLCFCWARFDSACVTTWTMFKQPALWVGRLFDHSPRRAIRIRLTVYLASLLLPYILLVTMVTKVTARRPRLTALANRRLLMLAVGSPCV